MFEKYMHQDLAVTALLLEEEFTRKAMQKRISIHKLLHERKSEQEYYII
jgi:hypothetical protein